MAILINNERGRINTILHLHTDTSKVLSVSNITLLKERIKYLNLELCRVWGNDKCVRSPYDMHSVGSVA